MVACQLSWRGGGPQRCSAFSPFSSHFPSDPAVLLPALVGSSGLCGLLLLWTPQFHHRVAGSPLCCLVSSVILCWGPITALGFLGRFLSTLFVRFILIFLTLAYSISLLRSIPFSEHILKSYCWRTSLSPVFVVTTLNRCFYACIYLLVYICQSTRLLVDCPGP